jgi:hypothetical protein
MLQHVLSSIVGCGLATADRMLVVAMSFFPSRTKVYCHALRQYAHTDLACEKQLVDFVFTGVEFCIPIAYAVLLQRRRE